MRFAILVLFAALAPALTADSEGLAVPGCSRDGLRTAALADCRHVVATSGRIETEQLQAAEIGGPLLWSLSRDRRWRRGLPGCR